MVKKNKMTEQPAINQEPATEQEQPVVVETQKPESAPIATTLIERTFKHAKIIKHRVTAGAELFPRFDGDLSNLSTLRVADNLNAHAPWNECMPVPLQPGEIVYIHPDQSSRHGGILSGYVRVIHGENRVISVFSLVTIFGPAPEPEYVPEVKPVENAKSAVDDTDASLVVAPMPVKVNAFSFNGGHYSKSGVVHAVVKQFVIDHPGTTLADLKEAFPDTLMRRFGIVQEVSKAREIANNGPRYNKAEIPLSDCVVVVCNQITSDNIKPFLIAAVALGYNITDNNI